jgi:hypothetical protein
MRKPWNEKTMDVGTRAGARLAKSNAQSAFTDPPVNTNFSVGPARRLPVCRKRLQQVIDFEWWRRRFHLRSASFAAFAGSLLGISERGGGRRETK